MKERTKRTNRVLTYLSLGAGVQSSALYVLACQGKIDRPDVAIFADVQDEPPWVYEQIDRLDAFGDIPIHRPSKGKLSEWLVDGYAGKKRFPNIPAFTLDRDTGARGMLRRQCTVEFKIDVVTREVRKILGLRPRYPMKRSDYVVAQIGISIDEAVHRMKPSRTPWIENVFPLVDLKIDRHAAAAIVEDAGLPRPKKSSCFFCPFHDDRFWRDLRDSAPELWEKAVALDKTLRNLTRAGDRHPIYLHSDRVPLDEVDLDKDRAQGNLFLNECEGMCGV